MGTVDHLKFNFHFYVFWSPHLFQSILPKYIVNVAMFFPNTLEKFCDVYFLQANTRVIQMVCETLSSLFLNREVHSVGYFFYRILSSALLSVEQCTLFLQCFFEKEILVKSYKNSAHPHYLVLIFTNKVRTILVKIQYHFKTNQSRA